MKSKIITISTIKILFSFLKTLLLLWVVTIFNNSYSSIVNTTSSDTPSSSAVTPWLSIKKLDWNGIPVIWVKDETLPVFYVNFYFADGALSDDLSRIGETETTFELLTSGTNLFSQAQIAEMLEFYGTKFSTEVTHEYSIVGVMGLSKDAASTMKTVCHLFTASKFPYPELVKYQKFITSQLENIASSPNLLAERAARSLSLRNTPYAHPASPTKKSIWAISPTFMKKKLNYFNQQVKKRIYISGPASVLNIKSIIEKECGWKSNSTIGNYVRRSKYIIPKNSGVDKNGKTNIFLIDIPRSNQAQIRISSFLPPEKIKEPVMMSLGASFLGGGSFSSLLMQELRVKHGLTYGVNAFAIPQLDYGRTGIATSTKTESVEEALNIIRENLRKTASGEININDFNKIKNYLAGSYLIGLEDSSVFLNQLIYYDHTGRSYEELYNYPKIIAGFTASDIAKKVSEIFDWNKQTILVVGDRNLQKRLQSIGNVIRLNYKSFL